MECSFCQRAEVVYLNELQLKSVEVRKCVARLCTHARRIDLDRGRFDWAKQDGITTEANGEERVNPHRKRIESERRACSLNPTAGI